MRSSTIVLLGCLAALTLRLLLAAQAPALAAEAYETVRQAEHIAQTGLPFTIDPLEPGTQPQITLPVFPYLVAFGTIAFGTYAYILIPNILAVLLHAALFWMAFELTQHKGIATTAMIASIAIPSYLATTLLTVSPLSLALPLIVVILTLFIKLRKSKEKRNILLLATIILLATHPIGLLIVPIFLVALILATIRRARDVIIQYEFAIFTTFFATWAYILLFKREIARHGLDIIQGNLPEAMQGVQYGAPDLLAFGIAVGVVPFGLAIYAAYKEGATNHAGAQIALAFGLVAFFATIAHLLPTTTGVTLVAIACIALAAIGLEWVVTYLKTMRATALPTLLVTIGIIAFTIASIIPTTVAGISATTQTVPSELIEASAWLQENSLRSAIILAKPEWGSAIAWASKRPVFIDDEYLSDLDSDRKYDEARKVLSGEHVRNIVEGQRIEYIITDTEITHTCLNKVYGTNIRVLKVLC